jgi:hypothetical protein
VLQRNDTHYPYTFTGAQVRRVLPGETTEHPVLLLGWTAVEDETPEPEPTKTTTRSKRTTAADNEGGEQL